MQGGRAENPSCSHKGVHDEPGILTVRHPEGRERNEDKLPSHSLLGVKLAESREENGNGKPSAAWIN